MASPRDSIPTVSVTLVRGVAMLLAAVIVVAGITVLSAFASWRFGQVSTAGDVHALLDASSERSVNVRITVGSHVEAELALEVDNDDPILQDSAQRALRRSPYLVLGATGTVRITGTGGDLYPAPTAVTTTTSTDTSVLSLRLVSGEIRASEAPFAITYMAPYSAESEVSIETGDDWVVTSALPRDRIETQTGSSAGTAVLPAETVGQSVEFGIASRDAVLRAPTPGSSGRNWMDSTGAGVLLWTFVAWAGFFLWLRHDRRTHPERGAATTPAPWTAFGPLVGALGLFSLTWFLDDVDAWWRRLPRSTSALEAESVLGQVAHTVGSGMPSLAVVALGFAWGWSMVFRSGQRTGASRGWALAATATCLASGAALLIALFAIPVPDYLGTPMQSATQSAVVLLVAAGAVLAGAATLIRLLSGRHGLLGGVATAAVGAGIAASSSSFRVPWLGVAAHVLVVAVITFVLCALVNRVAHDIGSASRTVRTWLVLGTASITVASSGPRTFAESEAVGLSEAGALSYLFVDVLTIALATLLVVGAARASRQLGTWIYRGLFFIAVISFLRFTTFVGVPLSLGVGIVLVGALLIRRGADTAWFPGDAPAIAESVRVFVRQVGSRRMDRDFADGLRKAISKGDVPADKLEETKSAIARVHYESAEVSSSSMSAGGIPASALRRGAFGAAVATVAGAPFALDSIRHILETTDDASGPFVLVASLGTLLGLRFPVYGFAFGFLFPVLRCNRGLAKALVTAFVLVVTEAIVLLVPFSWDEDLQRVLLLRVLQLLTVFLALGFAFDLRSLRSAGLGLDRVGDVYSVNRLVVWGSGLVVAAAAAFATALLDSAADTLLRLITGVSP